MFGQRQCFVQKLASRESDYFPVKHISCLQGPSAQAPQEGSGFRVKKAKFRWQVQKTRSERQGFGWECLKIRSSLYPELKT